MHCVTTVICSIMVNGHQGHKVITCRGLRQGDFISPYLYLLCTEWLNSLLKQAEAANKIFGFQVAWSSPPLTHLFLANESLLFCKSSFPEWLGIQIILNTYDTTSGQCLNRHNLQCFLAWIPNLKLELNCWTCQEFLYAMIKENISDYLPV